MSLIHTCMNIYDTALAAISRGMLRGLRLLICLYDKAASLTYMYVCALLPYMPVFYYYAVVAFFLFNSQYEYKEEWNGAPSSLEVIMMMMLLFNWLFCLTIIFIVQILVTHIRIFAIYIYIYTYMYVGMCARVFVFCFGLLFGGARNVAVPGTDSTVSSCAGSLTL